MKIFECLHKFSIIALAVLFASCSRDAYETGDSSLSYLKAEMVNIHVVGKQYESIVTDADESLDVSSSLTVQEKMVRADTTYRAMLYYNKVEGQPVELKSIHLAGLIAALSDKSKATTLATDPLTLTSMWKAQNNKYINLSLGLMTGNADSKDAMQKLSLVCDSVRQKNGSRCYYLTLHHDQASVPQYYTQTYYFSIPIAAVAPGDQICIRMNTYNGWVEKEYVK